MNALAKDNSELFGLGLSCWENQTYGGALSYLQKAHQVHPDIPIVKSYLGMTMIKEDMRMPGIALCQDAVRANPFRDDLVFNLGQAYLLAGNRAEAKKTFIQGLKGCDDSQRFVNALEGMGVRRKPVIHYPPRSNFLRRWLGKINGRPENSQIEDTGKQEA
jgi:predicted Zn-dependent protease